ncbi:UBX domain-containing protein 2A isoform X3 [Pipistrellus kuhlii]|uniref:UBX domain-containing protein 2A isoform X3 n=1 Tax=Pipistrellus kuhlii TaxID=59472 RepID=UPI00174F2A54|nr:UBX domain-containing protein 2A isoform X3 [Pipistrellus kuhlii]
MKEVDNLEGIKEWVCETGSDNQPLGDSRQATCEYFVDSLFEEAQKVGAKCLSPTEQKKQVDINIKLWKNGFTVNDDFRSYSDSASQQFLNSIKKGATPKIISKTKSIEVEKKNNLSTVPLNDLEPITSIQIWLASGKRIVQKFNMSHRISHIRDFIEKYQGSHRSPPFSLATARPYLRLLDEALTLEEADLQNAVIIQRPHKTTDPCRGLS